MKQSRQILLSILLTAGLLVAPASIAEPQAPTAPSFDVVEFLNGLLDDIVAIMAPAGPTYDPNGTPTDDGGDAPTGDDDDARTGFQATRDGEPAQRANPTYDPNG
ncbi:MAG: hypothetical protein AAFX50_26545 [Acidobacteriota bacterium]